MPHVREPRSVEAIGFADGGRFGHVLAAGVGCRSAFASKSNGGSVIVVAAVYVGNGVERREVYVRWSERLRYIQPHSTSERRRPEIVFKGKEALDSLELLGLRKRGDTPRIKLGD